MVETVHKEKSQRITQIISGVLFLIGIGLVINAIYEFLFIFDTDLSGTLYLFLCGSILIVNAVSYWFVKRYAIILNGLALVILFPLVITLLEYPFLGLIPLIVLGVLLLAVVQAKRQDADSV